ncbi:heterokaryon incompatibility protein-domain-containing protein [Lasiosphaeria ovina]|uniref:Heterokaryon incompatibility protein-domain-containing protein n=1 Tax=Lasiosphaeria ovina TaxID=92902 RepID=A0AAE0KNB7_9PEZI|nr:heterokaryon incompatibility protein-domain-containing protein [Lasiosphaeria ovina]
MWLLNVETLVLEHFQDDRQTRGQYAILSHTWGDEEVSFDTLYLDSAKSKSGYRKIVDTCRQAASDGLRYAWVDTCCIDKRSSSELSEAINSMYRWYYHAQICYAYLSDFTAVNSVLATGTGRLKSCRWFTRGWTLQELIAPPLLVFYDSNWTMLASRKDIAEQLANITHVDQDILVNREQLWQTSVAKRMSWASMRVTSREEDLAYSLLGIFGINMPLLYGEGPEAFKRLQEEIIRSWGRVDHSILAWHGQSDGLLALSPAEFPVHFPETSSMYRANGPRAKRDIISWTSLQNESFELYKNGLRITLYARAIGSDLADEIQRAQPDKGGARDLDLGTEQSQRLLVALNCTYSGARDKLFAMYLRRRPWINYGPHQPTSANHHEFAMYDFETHYTTILASQLRRFTMVTLTIARKRFRWPPYLTVRCHVRSTRYAIRDAIPLDKWQREGIHLVFKAETKPSDHEDPAYLIIRQVSDGGSSLAFYMEHRWNGGIPALGIRLDEVGGVDKQKLETVKSGEKKVMDFGGHAILVVMAEIFFMADSLVWVLAMNDIEEELNL